MRYYCLVRIKNIPELLELANIHSKIENIKDDKDALGIFKFKQKKILQEQISTMTHEVSVIQGKINLLELENKKKIELLNKNIKDIDEELTRKR